MTRVHYQQHRHASSYPSVVIFCNDDETGPAVREWPQNIIASGKPHRRRAPASPPPRSPPPPHRQVPAPCFTAGFTCRFASSPSVLRHHNYIAITATMLHHHATPCSITIIAPSTLSPHHQVPPPCFIVGLTSNFAPSPASLP
jgi:hypothetical protein